MKGIVKILCFIFSIAYINGQQEEENSFQKSEDVATGVKPKDKTIGDEELLSVGNPPGDDEIPIDEHIPVLLIAGVSIIIYKYRYKLKIN